MTTVIDPITLEVLTEGLISVVREMRATVFRTARSVAIYEAKDFSCGLFDHTAQVVAQSEDIGAHVVPLPWSVRSAMEDFGESLAPDDVILLNDPYRGGTHLNDVTLIAPLFEAERLILFPAVREHWSDVGGMVPGSLSGLATEIYQEGMRIPPVKIVARGSLNTAAMDLILSNMRVPDERLGDFHAGLAACKTAERRIRELVARYGLATLLEAIRLNLDRSEARMREKIASLPDGEYHYEDYLETFPGGRLEPLLLPLSLTIRGEEIIADFTGASPQVPVPVNSTLAVTAAGVFIALKSILDPDAPLNQGSFRPITVVAPEGTIVNVKPHAPAGSHGEIRKRVIAVMVGALAQVVPELVAGDLFRTSFHNLVGGMHPRTGRQFVHYEWASGGNGAFAEDDGPSAMASIDWGDLNTVQPAEVLESRFPLLVESSGMAPDSGGAGRRRGGLAMRRALRLLGPEATYSVLADGAVVPAFGILGGGAGVPVGSHVVRDGRELPFSTPGKVSGFRLVEGDVVVLQSPGGGGYGDPLEREPERVAEDVREGYVTAARARERYGVVLRDDFTVDAAATDSRRARLAAARCRLAVAEADRDLYRAGAVSRHRICPLNPADATRIGVGDGDLVELVGARVPLRAWLVVDASIGAGEVPLDECARRILRVASGDRIEIRPPRGARRSLDTPGGGRYLFIPVTSLRQWLETLEAHDLLVRVRDPIDINHIAAATAANYTRASLFERVVGYDIPVATNVVSNRKMLALALGVTESQLLPELEGRLRDRIPPVRVSHGACQEVVLTGDGVDLTRFPIHLQHELDGGPYITAGVLAARHPVTGVPNVGIYRMMFRTLRETGIDLTAPHKLRRYYQLACDAKRPLPVACVLGLHGVDLLASVATTPEEVDEYEVMGALRRQPVELVRCRTIDVEVPADAEIVFECEMPPDGWVADEGPYGEFTGTYGGLKRNPVLRVKAITHRREPVFLSATHGGHHPGWTDFYLLVPLFELTITSALRAANIDVRGIRFHPGSSGMWAIVSIKQWSAGDARNALHLVLAASNQNFPKYAVVVDEDIDIFDDERVYWAMTWRTQAHEDVHVFTGMKCIPLDPSLPTEMPPVTTSKMGIDATVPVGRERLRFTVCQAPFMAEVARLFGGGRESGG